MSHRGRALLALGGLLCVEAAVGRASPTAQEPSPASIASARIHFQAGREYYAERLPAKAFAEFVEAYRLSPRAELLFNRALCLEALKLDGPALACYRAYLRDAVSAAREDRLVAEERVAALEQRAAGKVQAGACPSVLEQPSDVALTQASPRPPVYKRWWPWTILGVAVAAGVGIGVGVGLTRPPPAYELPPVR